MNVECRILNWVKLFEWHTIYEENCSYHIHLIVIMSDRDLELAPIDYDLEINCCAWC